MAFIELGYLGSWGEWNTAGTPCGATWNGCRAAAPVLLAGTVGEDRITFAKYVVDTYRGAGLTQSVGLRRPEFYKDAEFNLGVAKTEMGFYNDCFMNSADESGSDGGTFSRFESGYNGTYPELYPDSVLPTAALAKQYMQENALNGAQGGENCRPLATAQWKTSPSNVPPRMDADGFHYFKPGTRDAGDFRQTMIETADAVHGTVWNHLKSRLGYRFHARQVSYPSSVPTGAPMTVSIDIENSGFNNIARERTAYLVLRSEGGTYVVGTSNPRPNHYTVIVPNSQAKQTLRSWNKAEVITFSQTFPAPNAGVYTLHLFVPDPSCREDNCSDSVQASYAVRLATLRNGSNVFNVDSGLNDLDLTFAVTSAPTYTLAVRTYNQADGSEIRGLWTVVLDVNGTRRTGFSPLSFSLPGGSTRVSVADFAEYSFDHWEDNSSARPRTLELTATREVAGYYVVSQ